MAGRSRIPIGQRYKRYNLIAEEHGLISPLVPVAQFKVGIRQ